MRRAWSSHPNDADIFVTRVSGDGTSFDAAWQLSDEAHRSAQPSLAHDGVSVVVWHDNRDELLAPDAGVDDDGEVYAASLSCP